MACLFVFGFSRSIYEKSCYFNPVESAANATTWKDECLDCLHVHVRRRARVQVLSSCVRVCVDVYTGHSVSNGFGWSSTVESGFHLLTEGQQRSATDLSSETLSLERQAKPLGTLNLSQSRASVTISSDSGVRALRFEVRRSLLVRTGHGERSEVSLRRAAEPDESAPLAAQEPHESLVLLTEPPWAL